MSLPARRYFTMSWITLSLLLLGALSVSCVRKEAAFDVLEGKDITLQCPFNNPGLINSNNALYWMKQINGENADNVAIGDQAYHPNYKIRLVEEESRYDLIISQATYERDNGL